MTKTCEICGDTFDGKPNQKYCKKCGKSPEDARKHYSTAERRVAYHMGLYDVPKDCVCRECGLHFKSIYDRSFCSSNCETKYRIKSAKCTNCGQLLLPLGIEIKNPHGGVRFCSEKCRKEYNWKIAEAKGLVKACLNCGKKYIGKNKLFCCDKCMTEAKEKGIFPIKKEKPAPEMITKTCPICKKEFETLKSLPDKFCSQECSQKYRVLYKKYMKKKEQEQKLKQRQNEINKNGLCAFCKTNYSNCERIKSKFVDLPENAVSKIVNGKTIVTSCPKFTE